MFDYPEFVQQFMADPEGTRERFRSEMQADLDQTVGRDSSPEDKRNRNLLRQSYLEYTTQSDYRNAKERDTKNFTPEQIRQYDKQKGKEIYQQKPQKNKKNKK
jgi:hypothetical protein